MLLLINSLSASTISTELQSELDARISTISQMSEAFGLAQSQTDKKAWKIIQNRSTSIASSEDLENIITQLKVNMTQNVENNATLLINNITQTSNYMKALISEASANNDWEFVREIKAFRTASGFFEKGNITAINEAKEITLSELLSFWSLTSEEKGRIFNRLSLADANSTALKVGKNFKRWISKSSDGVEFSLENAPLGMRIQPKSGWLTWNPTDNQLGEQKVTVIGTLDGTEVQRETVTLFVKYRAYKVKGLFVKLQSSDLKSKAEDGSAQHPFSDLKSACEALSLDANKTSIFVRGGYYEGVASSTSISNCHGDENNSIVVRPWGEEQVSIAFNSRAGLQVRDSSYVTVQGFEIIGASVNTNEVNYADAIAHWWEDNDLYQGAGIAIRDSASHILVQKNIVHDTTASGIKAVGASSVIIKENIVYNCAWWTTQGTTGIGITLASANDKDTDNSKAYNKMVGNLIFNNESRIYSHVWGKGMSELKVDEGEAVLVQEANLGREAGYQGRYLIQNNFIMNNGKTVVVNKAGRVDIRRNSYYMNGTTTANKALYFSSGLRVNFSDDVTFKANAIDADEEHGLLYSVATNSADAFSQQGAISNNLGRGATMPNELLVNGIYQTSNDIFQNPSQGNFTVISDENRSKVGADMNIMKKHKIQIKRYAISLEPNNYEVDNVVMTQDVIDNIPEGSRVISREYNGTKESYLIIKGLPSSHPFIQYQKEHGLAERGFKLFLSYDEGVTF